MLTCYSRHAARAAKRAAIAAMFASVAVLGQAQADGFFTLTGEVAAGYAAPSDTTLIRSMPMERFGLTYERYQQTHEGAKVLGGQVTIHRDDDGNVVRVMGAHYPDIVATNTVRVTAAGARGLVDRDIGPDGERDVTLMIDPANGQFFWRVETRRATSRWVHWIGAGSGATLNKFDALTNQACTVGDGYGMAFDRDDELYADDRKVLDCLITPSGSGTRLVTDDGRQDGRQETHDQGSSRRPFLGPIATHGDSLWDIPGRESPGTGALVDAHYYMALADSYFRNQYSFDVTDPSNPDGYIPKIVVHAHFTKNYVNAFWNGSYFAFGDGDGVDFDPLTSLDVAAHEFTHSVTEFTSDLIYQDESGALNESFSDIMAAVIERLVDDGNSPLPSGMSPSEEPDLGLSIPGTEWTMGEDFDLRPGEDGFRDMADPAADGDPVCYQDRFTGTGDNGGVHINSGISNHAFYWLVEGEDVDIQRAGDIFYLGYTGLNSNANFSDARAATIMTAVKTDAATGEIIYDEEAKVIAAWNHVGVDAACGHGVAVDNPPNAGFDASCTNLACTFIDTSTDEGTITWSWAFGDDATSTAQNPSHDYGAGATYTVRLTVTDSAGQTDFVEHDVTVSDGSGGSDSSGDGIGLTAETFKVRGVRHAWLTWTGVGSEYVDIYLGSSLSDDGVLTASPSPYNFLVGGKGGGSFLVKVCEAEAPGACSDPVALNY
jgi:Zn-dependent metalloprotease